MSSSGGRRLWDDPQAVAIIIAGVLGAAAVIVAALIGSGVLRVSAGPVVSGRTPSATDAPPTTGPSPSTVPTPAPSTPGTSTPGAGDKEVRRSTSGGSPLILSGGYSVDLDSQNPAWNVMEGENKSDGDLFYSTNRSSLIGTQSDFGIVDGPAAYETCANFSGYRREILTNELEAGVEICVRTSQKRFALLTVEKVSGQPSQVQLGVVVWEPTF